MVYDYFFQWIVWFFHWWWLTRGRKTHNELKKIHIPVQLQIKGHSSLFHVWTTCFVLSLFIGLGSKDISAIFLDSWWCHCIVYQKFTTWVIHSILSQTWWTGKECDYPLQIDRLVSNKLISYFLTVDAFETCSHIISYFWFPPCSHYSSYHLHCSDAGRGNYQVFATLNLVN